MKLVIPTYNRSAKLFRTLECYSAGNYNIQNIIVIDGSHDNHKIFNEKNCHRLGFEYLHYSSNLNFVARLHSYLTSTCRNELVCIGTDEDVFCSSYINDSDKFLTENKDYSSYIGRYITLGKPLLGLKRLIYARDHITNFDLSYEDPVRRLIGLNDAILVGCSPVFWSARRRNQLIKSLEAQMKMKFESTQESIDQVYLSLSGKIKFVKDPMLLRDETNIGYKFYKERHEPDKVLPESDFKRLKTKTLEDNKIENLELALIFLEDRWRPLDKNIIGSQNLILARHKRYYSAFEDFEGQKDLFGRIVRTVAKIGIVTSEIIAWFIAKQYLRTKVGSKVINKFIKSIPTHALFK